MKIGQFVKTDTAVVAIDDISSIDCSQIEKLQVCVYTKTNQAYTATNLNAIELLMQTRPSALEGKRLKWAKFSWIIHNVFAHPLMQFFALLKMYKIAFWIHDSTVPRPLIKQ